MNTLLFNEITQKTLNGEIHFGQVVAQMIELGVESYRTDFVRKETTYYKPNGETFVCSLPFEDHPLAIDFSVNGLQSAIKSSQKGEIKFHQFIPRALDSGVTNYVVYFKGEKVIYFGRKGETHTEYFPKTN